MHKVIRTLRDVQISYARECVAKYEESGRTDRVLLDIARIHIETARKLNRIGWKRSQFIVSVFTTEHCMFIGKAPL